MLHKINAQKWRITNLLPALTVLSVFTFSCKKEIGSETTKANTEQLAGKNSLNDVKVKSFMQVNLVANNVNYNAAHVDATLKNAWGIAWSPGGTAWVNAQGGNVS